MRAALLLAAALAAAAPARAADPAQGREVFALCAACHTLNGESGVGPTLKGVLGRRAGALEEFRYSPAMRRSGIIWEPPTLDRFLADPQSVVRGNRMPFAAIEDAQDRADLVAFLAAEAR